MERLFLDLARIKTDQLDPASFLSLFPGTVLQYFDDTPARDPRKAFSTSRFEPEQARQKQAEDCGVFFSPNAFAGRRRLRNLRHVQAVYLDIDVAKHGDGQHVAAINRRKVTALLRLTLRPPWPHVIIETKHGMQAIWRVHPVGGERGLWLFRAATDILLRRFGGDPGAKDVTRVLRLPGFRHRKNPAYPFPCRLIWNSLDEGPYDIQTIIDAFYLPPQVAPPLAAPVTISPCAELDVARVIADAAREAGITVTFRANRDGSRQIVENGEVTSGFVSARGNFCHSASGKARRGGPVPVVRYYLGGDRAAARRWLRARYGPGGEARDSARLKPAV